LLKRPSAERTGELLILGRNQLRTMLGLLREQSFNTTLFKVGLVVLAVIDANRHLM